MTFRFSGFGKSQGLFGGKGAADCGLSGFGKGGHDGGLFGNLKAGFGKLPGFGQDRDRDDHDHDDRDDDDRSCGTGSGSNHGTGGATGGNSGSGGTGNSYPDIPANTAGITFHVDYEGDGVEDNYIPVGRDNDTKTFEDYLAKARDQVATDNPDVDPKEVIVKATITSQSGEESYYHFTGLKEDSTDAEDEDNSEDGDDDDCNAGHGGGRGRGGRHDRDDDRDDDRSCGDRSGGHNASGQSHADFFTSLIGGGRSFDCGSDDDLDEEDDNNGVDDEVLAFL